MAALQGEGIEECSCGQQRFLCWPMQRFTDNICCRPARRVPVRRVDKAPCAQLPCLLGYVHTPFSISSYYASLGSSLTGMMLPFLVHGFLVWYRVNAGKIMQGMQSMIWCVLYQGESQQSHVTGNSAADAFLARPHCNPMHDCRVHSIPGPGM